MFDEKINQMLSRYQLNTVQDHENALKEIIQEIALLGLWRSKFYEKAVFYGGSALRILYGLDRFSEDLGFSLIQPEQNFNIEKHLSSIVTELESWGFEISAVKVEKKVETPKKDVAPFLKNASQKEELTLWSNAFFTDYLIKEIGVLKDDESDLVPGCEYQCPAV
jgi:predicted nucleotidyltransferase component of viral defense system